MKIALVLHRMKRTKNEIKSIEIRPAQADELSLIQDLAYEIWPEYYTSIIALDQIEYMLRTLYSIDALEAQTKAGSLFFLIWKQNKPVGFLGIKKNTISDLHIEKLYLVSSCRGKGYGKSMLSFAREQGEKFECTHLTLNVNRFNEALWFYRAAGFTVRKEIDIPFGPYVLTDYIMEKTIG